MVTATGSISLAEENARSLLANLAAFRTWCGKATAELAKAVIFTDAAPAAQAYPYAEIYADPDGPGFEMSLAGSEAWDQRGELRVLLLQTVPVAYATSVLDAERAFKNSLGAIVDEIAELSGSGDACEPLTVTRLRVFGPWRFSEDFEEQALGKIQAAGLILEWEY